MSEPYLGTIVAWCNPNRIPEGWALCDGRQMTIAQNQALYAVLGVTYGGDSRNYFNLPNLSTRFLMGAGTNPVTGMPVPVGATGGQMSVALTADNVPVHTHGNTTISNASATMSSVPLSNGTVTGQLTNGALQANPTAATINSTPGANTTLANSSGPPVNVYANSPGASGGISVGPVTGTVTGTVSATVSGGTLTLANVSVAVQPNSTSGQGMPTVPPYCAVPYIIAITGIYPTFD